MWMRMIVNQMVRQAAEDKVKGFLFDQVDSQSQGGGELTAEQLQSDAMLIFGSRPEAGGWVDAMEDVQHWPMDEAALYRGMSGSVSCLVIEMKPDKDSPELVDTLLSLAPPKIAIIAGFGIALSPKLGKRAMVVATSMMCGEEQVESSLNMEATPDNEEQGLFFGPGLSQAAFPKAGADRAKLFEQSGGLFCDPNGHDVAAVCERHAIPWTVVRVMTERSDEMPSLRLSTLLNQETMAAKLGAAVSSLWNEPSSAGELWQIQEDALKASDRLAKFLGSFLTSLG